MQQNVPSLYMPSLNVNFSFTEGVGIGNVKVTVVQHFVCHCRPGSIALNNSYLPTSQSFLLT